VNALSRCAAALLLLTLLPSLPAGADSGESLKDLWVLGEGLLGEDKVDEALDVFSAALEIDKDQPRTWNYIGGIHFLKADYLKALLDFKQAFALDPGDARACNNIATAYDRLGRYEEAESYYLRAIEIDETYDVPYRNLGILYADQLGRPRMARTYWMKFLDLSPLGPGSAAVRDALKGLDDKTGEPPKSGAAGD
jgi:tetratricopeptide (TPR) repeat protein